MSAASVFTVAADTQRVEPELAATSKPIFAITLAFVMLAAGVAHWRRRRSPPALLLLAAASCFAIVAVAHVFEAFSVLPAAGWGQPGSVGHYIDLAAAVLSGSFALAAVVSSVLRRTTR